MKRLILSALLLVLATPAFAVQDIGLKQPDGTYPPLEGVGGAAKVTQSTLFSGEDPTSNSLRVTKRGEWETIAASQTDQILGTTGAAGNYLDKIIVTVATAATAAVCIKDGTGSCVPIVPNSPGGGIGVYVIPIEAYSQDGGWKVTTGAGSSVVATGDFD